MKRAQKNTNRKNNRHAKTRKTSNHSNIRKTHRQLQTNTKDGKVGVNTISWAKVARRRACANTSVDGEPATPPTPSR